MSRLTPQVILTPVDGSAAVTLPGQATADRASSGNVVLTFEDLTQDYLALLAGLLAVNVEQYRNRDGAYEAYTDPGCKLVTVEYDETNVFEGALQHRSFCGVVELSGYTYGSRSDSMRLQVYRCDYRLERTTGVEETCGGPALPM